MLPPIVPFADRGVETAHEPLFVRNRTSMVVRSIDGFWLEGLWLPEVQ